MCHKLKEGAILIADSHYPNHKKGEFLTLLNAINSGKIKTPQLIFMGDNFDLLVGNSPYLEKLFKKEIELIKEIATKIEVIYLEGNHDFYLEPLFRTPPAISAKAGISTNLNIKIIPIQKQPLIMNINNQTLSLSHGDKYDTTFGYKLYTSLIRNPIILKLLPDLIAINKLKSMANKNLCKEIKNFDSKAKAITKNYKTDLIIEGHFHQGLMIDNYISLPSFACSGEVGFIRDGGVVFEKIGTLIYNLQRKTIQGTT